MPDAVLVLNAGSSSIKFSVYALDRDHRLILDAKSQEANRASGLRISGPCSRVAVFAIPTDEELMIARHTLAVAQRS